MGLHQTKRLLHSKRNDQNNGKATYGIGDNIVNQISDKGLISKMYKELIQLSSKKINNPTLKWREEPNRHFAKA